jgi:hypothetical protein
MISSQIGRVRVGGTGCNNRRRPSEVREVIMMLDVMGV